MSSRFGLETMESPLQRFREPIASSALTIDFPPENDIAGYVASLPSSSPAAVEEALDRLIELTAWQEENQRAVAELGGPSLVVDLAKVRAKYLAAQTQPPAAGPDGADLRTVMKSLQLLLNLTGNEYLALKTGEVPGSLTLLVGLLSHGYLPLRVVSARVLINLTSTSSAARAAAYKAGVLRPAVSFLLASCQPAAAGNSQARTAFSLGDPAGAKLGVWLLGNLTSGLSGAPCGPELMSTPGVLPCVMALLTSTSTPAPVAALAATLVANLARMGPSHQDHLINNCGALGTLVSLLVKHAASPEDAAAAAATTQQLQQQAGAGGASGAGSGVPGDAGSSSGVLGGVPAAAFLMRSDWNHVLSAALGALSALCLDNPAAALDLAAFPDLASTLSMALEHRSSPWDSDYTDAQVVIAAHALIHVLGHMVINQDQGHSPNTPPSPGQHGGSSRPHSPMQLSGRMGSGRGVREGGSPSDRWLGAGAWLNGPEGDLVDGRASLIVRSPSPLRSLRSAGSAEEVSGRSTGTTLKASGTTGASAGAGGKKKTVYISLAQAARALGVTLATRSVMLGRKDGQQVLSHIEAAELRHRVTHVLLPRLRSPNAYSAATAAAALYHLCAACGGPAAHEARRLIADGDLVTQLLSGLSEGSSPALTHACLCILDILSAEPACAGVLFSMGWLSAVGPCLDSPDALVRRWAERSLCSLYVATGKAE